MFTANRCKANPVLWSQEVVKDGVVRAVVLNSGGANCYTGAEGFQTTHAVAEQVAAGLGIGAVDVVVCSTGLIGLTNDRGGAARRRRRRGRGPGRATAATDAATAIMTTDTVSKQVVVEGSGWSIGGMAKGAGHARPAAGHHAGRAHHRRRASTPRTADRALRAATRVSFDRLDSDGCMSTNDTVTLLASGASGITPDRGGLHRGADRACTDLAMQLLADAEGADHEIAITVLHAATEDDAVEVGRSVARSNLFKTAVFGKDPNWGRVLASIGTTDGRLRPGRPRRRDERRLGLPQRRRPTRTRPTSTWSSARSASPSTSRPATRAATVWTNDLTHAYVHENSAYSS